MTRQQRKALAFIKRQLAESGVAPSVDELRIHLGLASKSGVWWVLERLEAHGEIRRIPRRRRGIEIVQHIRCPQCHSPITIPDRRRRAA